LILPGVRVKDLKVRDVTRLLKLHFGDNWTENEDLVFYKSIIVNSEEKGPEEASEEENAGGYKEDDDDF